MKPWPNLTYFKREEFERPDSMDRDVLHFLDQVRALAGIPIRVTSDTRTLAEHEALYPNPTYRPNSPHLRGTAVDFKPVHFSAFNRLLVLWAILDVWRQDIDSPHPVYDRLGLEIADFHFHIDFDHLLTRPHMWLGSSR